MKNFLLFGCLTIGSVISAHACELLVNDIKLTANEVSALESKGFKIVKIDGHSKENEGKMMVVDRYIKSGADILWYNLDKEVLKIVKFWGYSEVNFENRPTLKQLNYVAREESMESMDSCVDVSSSLDSMIKKIYKTQLYPKHGKKHGAIYLK